MENGKSFGKENMNSELYKYSGDSFMRVYCFSITFMRWEKCRKSGKTILSYLYKRKVTNKMWNTAEELTYITGYILYRKILNEKFKAQAENILLEVQKGFRKGRSYIDPSFVMKLLTEKKRKQFNLESNL